MGLTLYLRVAVLSFTLAQISACTVDKLEARLQADPQCKSVVNSKTGTVMPCPGTDKEFYKSVPALNMTVPKAVQAEVVQSSPSSLASTPKVLTSPLECRPQLHQKSGSLMPCPAP
ncbi:hypothetical protein FD967_04705 [Polynucleobacter sp. JS-Mosq-20-D10]|uniref:hypothetical protein n=1 Tax=Polynucleobacter sp. JS-Mosq-20-D10 TaxID=2576922 RepID=UPI001BFDBCFB|nr:hypothetical protein [Polynucleobacter sp. JS-Mosq-20-D10]QWE01333.1 hypothetical protein FD967_04705 [Polynucleobacter sp. JS-Mosq-20-D10]